MWHSCRYLGRERSQTLRTLNHLTLMKQHNMSLQTAYTCIRSSTDRLGALIDFNGIVWWMSNFNMAA